MRSTVVHRYTVNIDQQTQPEIDRMNCVLKAVLIEQYRLTGSFVLMPELPYQNNLPAIINICDVISGKGLFGYKNVNN